MGGPWGLGLVIGKFLPPHAGHGLLIETARAGVGRLVVVVCDLPGQPVAAARRAGWLREIHPGVEVRVVEDIGRDEDSAAWAAYTQRFLGRSPDVVFSSEDYGERWAGELGCHHVLVDRDRGRFPVSGTAVRADPARHWAMLAPCVRAHYVTRVCLVGAESTGTTTLAGALAEELGTVWVPEYGRAYSRAKAAGGWPAAWETGEFEVIARRQEAEEDEAARRSGPVLLCDTDALATGIWHERYLGRRNPEVEARAAAATAAGRYRLTVLTGDEIPFVDDGLRDGEHLRGAMTGRFRQALTAAGRPFVEVRGSREERLAAALAAVGTGPD